jgi:hypothetical protein
MRLGLTLTRFPRVTDFRGTREELYKVDIVRLSSTRFQERGTDRFLLHAIRNALNDIVNNVFIIPVWFVVSEPHHSPARTCGVPVDLDDAVVDLLAGFFQPGIAEIMLVLDARLKRKEYLSHSSSSTNITSYSSYPLSPRHTCSANTGFAAKSGCPDDKGGNRRTSLKSIEFSEGVFHFILYVCPRSGEVSLYLQMVRREGRILTCCCPSRERRVYSRRYK